MTRIQLLLLASIGSALAASPARAQAVPALDDAGKASFELGWIALGAANNCGPCKSRDSQFELVSAGLELGLGKHLNDVWYVGATADLDLALTPFQDSGADAYSVLRVGGELRYVLGEGRPAAVRVDLGPWHLMPSRNWFGVRAGFEAIDGAHPTGGYGELELAHEDAILSGFHSTMVVALGVSAEPLDAYGGPHSSTVGVSPYALGEWRFSFE